MARKVGRKRRGGNYPKAQNMKARSKKRLRNSKVISAMRG
jgi:hypothetical protein